ncbi:energy-coupling factor ABC transporter substrate-binding protein [Peptostreptococcus sp.]|uniref:energy-coupling factor ABC transporter substrate-binding protein n=1 Tax=Peptostreptococcus sp. TaxID=1262 RepID=UPI002FC72F8C
MSDLKDVKKNGDKTVDSVEKIKQNSRKSESMGVEDVNKSSNTNKKSNKKTVFVLIVLVLVISIFPLFALKGAEFGGSDDAGSEVVAEIKGEDYEPWFTPVMEDLIGGEIPGEVESLLFCVQTGIGVAIVAYVFGYLVARKKYSR